MELSISPLAPKNIAELPEIKGLSLRVAETGIKYKNRPDLFIASFTNSANVAGVFTKSTTAAPAISWCRENLQNGTAKAVIVNAGNANAFTGEDGDKAVAEMAQAVADDLGCDACEVFVSSTGVIGEKLPTEEITSKIPGKKASWKDAAKAITTTDTFIKTASAQIDGANICGIAKGSGMIEPNMATMLAYIFTDADIEQSELQELLNETNNKSFNSITVDSDTSTSDTVLIFATGEKPKPNNFQEALQEVMTNLAQQIVRDGEGATKFIEVEVNQAESESSAKIVAKAIANSPLVKTAIAGEDANWGRVVMAVGKCEEPINLDKLEISFGDFVVATNGAASSNYSEEDVSNYIKNEEIKISVSLGSGDSSATVWTCDLTHGYISINADYRS